MSALPHGFVFLIPNSKMSAIERKQKKNINCVFTTVFLKMLGQMCAESLELSMFVCALLVLCS